MNLNYITPKVLNIKNSKLLYESFGLNPILEKHGNGPEHYSINIQNFILELYPLNSPEKIEFNTIRIGFSITDISKFSKRIEEFCNLFNLKFKYSPEIKKIELKDFEDRTIEILEL